jgi:hypothetical protein
MQIGGAGLEDCVADGDGGDGLEHVGSDASVEAQVAVPGDDLSEAVLDSCGGHEEEEGRRVLPVYLGCPSVSLSAWRRVRTSCKGYATTWPQVVEVAPKRSCGWLSQEVGHQGGRGERYQSHDIRRFVLAMLDVLSDPPLLESVEDHQIDA